MRRIGNFITGRLYSDRTSKLKDSILVAGAARSGTTWLASILAEGNGRIVFEPFNNRKVGAMAGFPYFPYLRPEDVSPSLYSYCQKLFRGEFRHPWVDRESRALRAEYRVIKTVRANLMLKWIQASFPQVPQLLLVRHPCAVALSRSKLEWATDTDIQPFLDQSALVDDFLAPYLNVIEEAETEIEKHAVIWCISYLIPLRQFEPEGLNLIFYEDLYDHPERELARIERILGRRLEPDQLRSLNRPSPTTAASSAILSGANPVTAWQSEMGPEEIERVLATVMAFDLDYLYGENPWPKARAGEGRAVGTL